MNKLILTKVNSADYEGDLYKDNVLVQSYVNKTAFETNQLVSEVVGCNNYTTVRINIEEGE